MLSGAKDDFMVWLKQPFSADMSATHWALFIGFILVLLAMWGMIFAHIKGATD